MLDQITELEEKIKEKEMEKAELEKKLALTVKRPAAEIVRECIEKGVLCLTAKDKVRLLPALNIPMDVLKQAIETIKAVCAED